MLTSSEYKCSLKILSIAFLNEFTDSACTTPEGRPFHAFTNLLVKKNLELVKIGVNFSQFEPISTSINKGIQLNFHGFRHYFHNYQSYRII